MTYTFGTIAKALVGFAVTSVATAAGLAHGADLTGLDVGQWMTALGAGLTAGGGVFVTPNKTTEPQKSPAEQAITSIQTTVQQATDATSELDKLRNAAGDVLGHIPGSLATQVINSIPKL